MKLSLRLLNRSVYIAGEGLVAVTRRQNVTLESMAAAAVTSALQQARLEPGAVSALYVGNMMSGMLSNQQHLGPLVANAAGLQVEAATAEVTLLDGQGKSTNANHPITSADLFFCCSFPRRAAALAVRCCVGV